jgi:8-oxo-dGTP pyrophosphatase MutT (NUDIX family)
MIIFLNKFYSRKINKIMEVNDLSCGVVPVKRNASGFDVLFCKSRRYGYYLIPKGHIDSGETELQAAIRELWEESGCRPLRFWTSNGWTENFLEGNQLPPIEYTYKSNQRTVKKTVKLYLAEVDQIAEIQDKKECESAEWFPANEQTSRLLHFNENIRHFVENVLPRLN